MRRSASAPRNSPPGGGCNGGAASVDAAPPLYLSLFGIRNVSVRRVVRGCSSVVPDGLCGSAARPVPVSFERAFPSSLSSACLFPGAALFRTARRNGNVRRVGRFCAAVRMLPISPERKTAGTGRRLPRFTLCRPSLCRAVVLFVSGPEVTAGRGPWRSRAFGRAGRAAGG